MPKTHPSFSVLSPEMLNELAPQGLRLGWPHKAAWRARLLSDTARARGWGSRHRKPRGRRREVPPPSEALPRQREQQRQHQAYTAPLGSRPWAKLFTVYPHSNSRGSH